MTTNQAVPHSASTAFLTDKYELTMLEAALADGSANIPVTFEMFARKLPAGRRYGIVAGTGRFLQALSEFRFTEEHLATVATFLNPQTVDFLRSFRFTGDIDGYPEGELYFPGSPIVTVRSSFGQSCIIETLLLSIFNHDCAIASAASRMSTSAKKRQTIEMGSRRTHEAAAISASRAAYIAGISATSNLEAARQYGIPSAGTSGHAFTLLHTDSAGPNEKAAFKAQVEALGVSTTLLVDTYDITQGVANAIEVAGPELGGVRIDSGDLGILAHQVRGQLDALGARNTKIVVSGDLDEYSIAALQAYPIDVYGIGTSLVTGSGAPTAGLVYKLVDVAGVPVAKRSLHKQSHGGIKHAWRLHRATGTLVDECYSIIPDTNPADYTVDAEELATGKPGVSGYKIQKPLVRKGEPVTESTVEDARALVQNRLHSLPWEALSLSHGDPALSAYKVS